MSARKLTPYEQNQLLKYGPKNINLDKISDIPIEYVTGKVEFADLVLEVNQHTLIPRIETEELVDLALNYIKQNNLNHAHIADVGTGCGAIGLSLANKLNKLDIKANLYLTDISDKTLAVCKTNSKQLALKNINLKIFKSDLLAGYPKNLKLDLILANLPYIPSQRINYLENSVKDYEPHLALDGGQQGLKLIKKLLKQAENKLTKKGKIFLEIDYSHSQKDLEKLNQHYLVETKLDSFSRTRFAIATKNPALREGRGNF